VVLFAFFAYAFGCLTVRVFLFVFPRAQKSQLGWRALWRDRGPRVLNQTPADAHAERFTLLTANIVNEQEKSTAQPTPERPRARNTSVWVVVYAVVQLPDDNSESSRPTGRERHPGHTQRRGVHQ